MILLDRIHDISVGSVRCSTRLLNHPYIKSGEAIDSAWSLEIASQACAAIIGKYYAERGYREGRLIKVSQWDLHEATLPEDGEISISAELVADSEVGAFIFNAQLSSGKVALAEGQLTILAK